jgi:hypothetical protein
MDRRGKLVLPLESGRVQTLGSGRFARFKGTSAAIIDDQGKALTGYEFSHIEPFHGGVAHVYRGGTCTSEECHGGAWFILDVSGKPLAGPFQAILCRPQMEATGILEADRWSLRNLSGKRLDSMSYDAMTIEETRHSDPGEFFRATIGLRMTYLFDWKGQLIFQGKEAEVEPAGRLLIYKVGGQYGLIKQTGKIVLTANYGGIHPMKNGMYELSNDRQYGLTDSNGKILIPPQCTELEIGRNFVVCRISDREKHLFEPDMAEKDVVNEIFLFDHQGRKINEQPYDEFRLGEDGSSTAVRGQNCSRIRDDGTPAFTLKCSDLTCYGKLCTFEGPGPDGVVDYSGKILLSGDYVSRRWWENFSEFVVGTDCSEVYCATKKVFYYDLKGRKLTERPVDKSAKQPKFRQNQVCEGRCTGKHVQTVLFDERGREVAIPALESVSGFRDGTSRVTGKSEPGGGDRRPGTDGLIDRTGKVIVPLKYTLTSGLESGFVRAYEGGRCEHDPTGKMHCRGGTWTILDSQGKEIASLNGLDAPNPVLGSSLLAEDRDGKEKLIDVHGKVLYSFRFPSNFENYFWQNPKSHPWFYEDAPGEEDGEHPTLWISVKGQVLGRPDSEMKLIGDDAEALLLEQEKTGGRYHLYAKTGEKILSTACRKFLETAAGFVCDELSEDKSGGALAFYDRQGKNVCAMVRSYAGNRVLPACMTGAPAAMPAAKPATQPAEKPVLTAFALVEVVRDHVIVRDAAGRFAALTHQGRWVSGFGRSWLIPTGEKNVFYFDPNLRDGKRQSEAFAFGLKDASGRVLTREAFSDMDRFRGGLTAVVRPPPNGRYRSYVGLINAQGKFLLDDPDATIVQISGGTALVTLLKPFPGTSAKQFITIVLDAQGRELVRMPDTDARQGDREWLGSKESDRKTENFVFTVHSECNLYPDFRICKKTTKGLMDVRGRILLKNIYSNLQIIGNGLFAVRKAADCRKANCADVPYSIINLKGEPISPATYRSVDSFGTERVFTAQKCRN